ncbi:TOBE domain-containing protein [Mollicutes bacterium LVI A0039]|nr:TOBE domain-containing protein [Mollicutes bacterium LVI A0039]
MVTSHPAYAKTWSEESGIEVEVKSGNEPDIVVAADAGDFAQWFDVVSDMPGVTWTENIELGIRPNEFEVDVLSMQAYSPIFKGTVTHKELIGHIVYIYVDVNGRSITIEVENRQNCEIGDEIEFTVNPTKVFVFDADT